jgi:DNA polymerase III gamma/tau subunit
MNLLQLLLSALLSNSSVNSVSKKTGLTSILVRKLIMAALPVLIKYLTQNVLSQGGAASLLNALTQHTSKRSMAEQIDEVDEEDGGKIIRHILGKDEQKVVADLAEETGLKGEEVTRGLASFAPALLSALSAATASSAQQQTTAAAAPAADLTSLFNTFAGQTVQQAQAQAQQPSGAAGLLNSLLGGGTSQAAAPSANTAASAGSLLSLLGQMAQPQQPVQQPTAQMDGTQLLNILASMMK